MDELQNMCHFYFEFLETIPKLLLAYDINPLNAELNPICHLLALLGGATIVVVSRLRVKLSAFQLMYLFHFVKAARWTNSNICVTFILRFFKQFPNFS